MIRHHFAVLNFVIDSGTDVTETLKHQLDNVGNTSVEVAVNKFGLQIPRR